MDCGMGKDLSSSADTMGDPGNFECNICFELPQEPIVTLCGHLYCWPCLYQWLQLHSHSHDCPVCKAIIQEDKLVPIYGRGKTNSDPRSRPIPGITVPDRPMGQRPQTAPSLDMDHLRPNDFTPMVGVMRTAAPRFSYSSLSTFFGALPAIFNLQVNGFHDATVYGATSGVPYLFSNSIHGGSFDGFYNYQPVRGERRPIAWKTVFIVLGVLILLHRILA